MWWPKLDENIQSIVDKYDNSSEHENLRTDRDILEEVLELSRLGASSIRRKSSSLNPAVVEDLVDITCSVVNSINESERRQDALDSMAEILKPLRYLIRQGDYPKSTRHEFLEKLDNLEFGEIIEDDEE